MNDGQLDKWGHEVGQDWTTGQLAEAASLSPGRIRQLVARGKLEHYSITPRLNMIPYHVGVRYLMSREAT
jgi:hypothetical protein